MKHSSIGEPEYNVIKLERNCKAIRVSAKMSRPTIALRVLGSSFSKNLPVPNTLSHTL